VAAAEEQVVVAVELQTIVNAVDSVVVVVAVARREQPNYPLLEKVPLVEEEVEEAEERPCVYSLEREEARVSLVPSPGLIVTSVSGTGTGTGDRGVRPGKGKVFVGHRKNEASTVSFTFSIPPCCAT
jgi:hypothetical protein